MKSWWKSVKSVKSHYKEKKAKLSRHQHLVMAKCVVCGARFQTARAHAESCSAACRMKKCRKSVVTD